MANVLGVRKPFPRTEAAIDTSYRGQILGWTGLIRVDNTSYTWMGAPAPFPTAVTYVHFRDNPSYNE